MDKELRVLIVEDSENDALLVKRELNKYVRNLVFEKVATPAALRQALGRNMWDIVLSDFSMPRFNGLDALRIVREKFPKLPFIIVTGAIGEELAASLMREGAHDFIMKGNLSRLVPAIERELEEAVVRLERERAEEELRESRRSLETLMSNLPGMAYRCLSDPDWTMQFVSEGCLELTGYEPDELIGNTRISYNEVIHRDDRESVWEGVQAALREKRPFTLVYRIIRKSGETRWAWEKGRGVDSGGEEVPALEGFITDITDRKSVEEELLSTKKILEEEAHISSSLLALSTSTSGLLDIKAISEAVCEAAHNLTSADKTAAFLRESHDKYFRAETIRGVPEHLEPFLQSVHFVKGSMPAIDAVLGGEGVFVENAKSGKMLDKSLAEALDIDSVVMHPLITEKGVVGAIVAGRRKPFSRRDLELLKGTAMIASTAMENVSLYRESMEISASLTRRVETVDTTYAIDRAILSTLDQDAIVDIVARNIQRIIPADRLVTTIFDEENKVYRYGSREIPLGVSHIMDSISRTGRVSSIPDIKLYSQKCPVVEQLLREGYGSLIALPIHSKEKRIGCIFMASRRLGAFDSEDIANAEKLTAQMSIALENARLYADVKELFMSTVRALTHTIDAKSPWTRGHSERVTAYAVALAREIGLQKTEIETLELAGLLHDIGKIGTYDILLDKPEKLTDEEFDLVKRHPAKSSEILLPIKQMKLIIPAIRHHHERLDGSGYPDGLKGDEIPLLARILCITDSFDSMTADRPYRPAPGREYAVSELRRCLSSQFDRELGQAFIGLLERGQLNAP